MMEHAISADGLTKRYGQESAVSSLDLAIPAGTVYAFLGPNGAGKTTTMRMLTGLTEPTSGTGQVAGVSIDSRAALTERLGYLPADPPIFEELTGREQLQYVARLHELSDDVARERIETYLDRFDMVEDADRRIGGYSTGMRKKIGVIGAILHEPEVVFLDEPTSGLDPRAARTMRDTIATLAEEDVTVFLSTHILPVAEVLADRVGVIHAGELVTEGTPAELTDRADSSDDATLETVFLEVTTDDVTDQQ